MDVENFFGEAREFYGSRPVLAGRLRVRDRGELLDFCLGSDGELDYLSVCMMCELFSGVLGERLPDNLHNRMVLGPSNDAVVRYLDGLRGLRPKFLGINFNRNRYPNVGLGVGGWVRRFALR